MENVRSEASRLGVHEHQLWPLAVSDGVEAFDDPDRPPRPDRRLPSGARGPRCGASPYPITAVGRITGGLTMMVGISAFAVVTAKVAEFLVRTSPEDVLDPAHQPESSD